MTRPVAHKTAAPAGASALTDALQAGVHRVAIADGTGGARSITLDPATNLWLLEPADAGGRTWPVSTEAVRGFLRLLADAAKQPTDAGLERPKNALAITVHRPPGPPIELLVGRDAVAGRVVLAEGASGPVRRVDVSLRDVLINAPLDEWRTSALVPRTPAEPGRIVVESGGRRLELQRTRGAWSVLLPVPSHADADTAGRLLAGIQSLNAARLLPAGGAPQITNPTALIRLVSHPPQAAGTTEQFVQEVLLGGPADAENKTFFCSARAEWQGARGSQPRPAWGPVTATIPREAIESLVRDPGAYISKRAVPSTAADASRLVLSRDTASLDLATQLVPAGVRAPRDLTFARDPSGSWLSARGSEIPAAATDRQRTAAAALLRLLCETDATRVLTDVDAAAGATAAARIEVGSSAASPLAVVGIGIVQGVGAEDNASGAVVVRTGRVWRIYESPQARELIRWISDELPPEG